jgi:tRNA pseudouridine38-40 synthase
MTRISSEKTIWKLTLAYDGTEFHGWQVQACRSQLPTIQGALADAISVVTGERVLPQGSGRTDAGVHAAAQVASFPLAASIPPANFNRALNRALPASIRVLAAEHAPAGFHARYSAVGKVYRYQIFHGTVCSPFLARYVARSRWQLDFAAMQQAAQAILGEHDFTSFSACDPDRSTRLQGQEASRNRSDETNSDADANLRRIDQSEWSCSNLSPASKNALQQPDILTSLAAADDPADLFTYTVQGDGFLHHMVRNLVGTFMEVGRGRIAPAAVIDILNARDRTCAGPTAAASGLCLVKVLY